MNPTLKLEHHSITSSTHHLSLASLQPALVAASIAICVFVIWQSIRDFQKSPVADLRNRVVGARCLMDGRDPYELPGAQIPEYYRAWTRTTISPAHLLLYAPLRNLSYAAQRKLYYITDLFFLVGCLIALGNLVQDHLPRPLMLFLFAALLVLDAALRLNLARGQSYLQLLLLASVSALGVRKDGRTWIPPVVFSILLLFRPSYVLALAALLLMRYRRFAARTLIALGLLVVPTVLLTGVGVWRSYFRMIYDEAEDHLQRAILGDEEMQRTAIRLNRQIIIPTIEGIDSHSFLRLQGFEHDRTFLGALDFRSLHKNNAKLPWISETELRTLNLALALLCASAGLYIAFRLRFQRDVLVQLAFAFLLPIDFETFGPQKAAYTDLLLALPLILLVTCIAANLIKTRGPGSTAMLMLVSCAFCFAALSRVQIGVPTSALSVGRFFVILAGANLFCVRRALSERSTLIPECSSPPGHPLP